MPAALLAAMFLATVHELVDLLWRDLPRELGRTSPPWYLVIGLPVVGTAMVVLARRRLPGDGGHPPLDGLAATPTPPGAAPDIALAALGTLAFGSVLGPEAPLIALGSGVGVALAGRLDLGERENAVLATAGSFSVISALFGGPPVAGLLLMEAGVGLGAALVPTLLPGLVTAASATSSSSGWVTGAVSGPPRWRFLTFRPTTERASRTCSSGCSSAWRPAC